MVWFLGFDCATKTLAFSLSRIDAERFLVEGPDLRAQVADALKNGALSQELRAVDSKVRSYLRLVDGETVDLFPGVPDASVCTVDRIRAVAKYVAERIRPAMRIIPKNEHLCVIVEYQMGQNARARTISDALVTLFIGEDVVIVGPSLKNKIFVCDDGQYRHFAAKHLSTYAANKAHTIYNFAKIEKLFDSEIPPSSISKRGHIADSFMQVMGYLKYSSPQFSKSAPRQRPTHRR
jgi:hypothetical protein